MSVEAAIRRLRLDSEFNRNVTTWQILPEQPARIAPFPTDLDPRIAATLHQQGIDNLYSHQEAAWTAARAGENWVVVTPTASGKTLCYNLPVAQALLDDPAARALYLFPTKALAYDQLAELRRLDAALGRHAGLAPATYDGDTPQRDRSATRKRARIVLTNPDMLHTGILPHHLQWAELFSNLRYVVIDELHAYRGVFGSHFANVLRRLRRICQFHGSDPQFLCASATIANPTALAERLVEAPVALIDADGAPKGERHIVFYNPPLVDAELGLRRSSLLEAERIAADLIAGGVQTVVFARARLTVEVLLTYLRERLATEGRGQKSEGRGQRSAPQSPVPSPQSPIRGYRGGYLSSERREIEQGLRDGSVQAVVATNALELGVNIGGLDAAVLTGFPGTIASAWQQAGRAGRRSGVSLAILVATAGPLDQYIITHPDYFFGRSPEHALINPDNLMLLSNHVACAAFELPFRAGEQFGRVTFTEEILDFLAAEGEVQQHGGDWFWMGEGYPAQGISLRTASPERVVIHAARDGQPAGYTEIGELERAAAPMLLHQGAVYLHDGEPYLVERLDWDEGRAWVRPAAVGYYTVATSSQEVRVIRAHEEIDSGGAQHAYGPVQVVSQFSSYRQVKLRTHETLGVGQIDLPEQVLETDAWWLAFGDELLDPLRAAGLWRSDPNNYGPNWSKQRDAARARDGYRCTSCGAPESPTRQHDVHHKRPFRAFGYVAGFNEAYRLANVLDNLTTLCRTCHQRAEQGQRLRTGLGGLAFALGSIAPLHLMCDPRDIGVVAEQQAAAGGLPTITVYEKIPAGIGFSQRLYEIRDVLLRAVEELVRRCPCDRGCPACVGPVGEEADEVVDAKALTLALVRACRQATNDSA